MRASLRLYSTTTFIPRSIFEYEGKINWFPGHMLKATREIKERLAYTDVILEVRDARISTLCSISFIYLEYP